MAKELCLVLDGENVPRINKEHYYFDQIQFQMGCTGAPWCDFIVYTLKGMVIDRVCFDKEHFQKICDIVQSFYFKHILPLLTRAEENSSFKKLSVKRVTSLKTTWAPKIKQQLKSRTQQV